MTQVSDMIEALVAVGLAGNVVQFVHTSAEILAQSKAIWRTGNPSSITELRTLTETLTKQVEMMQSSLEMNRANTTNISPEDQVCNAWPIR